MNKNWTSKAAAGVGVLVGLSAGLTTLGNAPGVDPNAVHAQLLAQPGTQVQDWNRPPLPVVGELAARVTMAAAPLGEGRLRDATPARRTLAVALGRNAAPHLSSAFTDSFRLAATDLDLDYKPSTERDAIELVTLSKVDFAVIGGTLSERDRYAGLSQAPIGCELFALAVNAESPVRSLTSQQVRQVLTGEVRRWSSLGFDVGDIRVVAPTDQALRDRAARTLVKGDRIFDEAELVGDDRAVLAAVRSIRNAIGVVRVRNGGRDELVRLLEIDWVAASADSFAFGTYPFGIPVQLVTLGYPNATALRFLDFARSEDGRELLSRNLLVR